MTSFGEHACIVGSAAALEARDWVYSQYREQGAHIWRGYTIDQVINQCIGNSQDSGKGRQMPVHYGSKALNHPTVSSPLSIKLIIQQHKCHKLQEQGMLSEQPKKTKSLLAFSGKELPAKVTSL